MVRAHKSRAAKHPKRVELRQVFLGLQGQMRAKLQTAGWAVGHPTARGDATEHEWLRLLGKYLPRRYRVASAFVIDADGRLSDQLDVVVYDRQYCPFILNQSGTKYIPAESVYAVFEVKPELSPAYVKYAGKKAASVRRLRRTSRTIQHAGGQFKPKEPHDILAGILCTRSTWKRDLKAKITKALRGLPVGQRLDLGCALEQAGFSATYGKRVAVSTSSPDTALVFFFLRLLARLQDAGTVPAIDLAEYEKAL